MSPCRTALPLVLLLATAAAPLLAQGEQALVEWRGEFHRADRGDNPAADKNDDTATGAITGIYQGGLAALKKLVEG